MYSKIEILENVFIQLRNFD